MRQNGLAAGVVAVARGLEPPPPHLGEVSGLEGKHRRLDVRELTAERGEGPQVDKRVRSRPPLLDELANVEGRQTRVLGQLGEQRAALGSQKRQNLVLLRHGVPLALAHSAHQPVEVVH
jgi:hypothetical protein